MTISHHLLRRRARAKAKQLNAANIWSDLRYTVEKTGRGPWRWRVVLVKTRRGAA